MTNTIRNNEFNANEKDDLIVFEETSRNYRTEIPNIVFELLSASKISHFAFVLYCVYRRTAGEHGDCYKGMRKLAIECGCSLDSIHNARKELQQKFDELGNLPLIAVVKGDPKLNKADNVYIRDIWKYNHASRGKLNKSLTCSPHEHPRSPHEHPRSPGEQKKEHSKKEPIKKMSEEDLELSLFLFDSLKKINPAILKPDLNLWANDLRLMQSRDGRSVEDIRKVIEFIKFQYESGDQYQYTIESAKSLREKYPKIFKRMMTPSKEKEKQTQENRHVEIIKENQQIANSISSKIKQIGRSNYKVDEASVRITLPDGQYYALSFAEHGFRDQVESVLRRFRML